MVTPLGIVGWKGTWEWEERNKLVPSKFTPQTEHFKGKQFQNFCTMR
jgi:hypothetical protein